MSNRINVIICPKDELGFDSASIRAQFNAIAPVLAEHRYENAAYLDPIDIAMGSIPEDQLQPLTEALDPHGFIVDQEKTVYTL